MNGILWIAATTIGGSIGWWLGSFLGLWAALLLSVVGTAGAIYAVRRYIAEQL